MKYSQLLVLSLCGFATALHGQSTNPLVRFHTTQGDIDVTLFPAVAPLTVANFLTYVNKGDYVNSIFHRSVPGFIIQAGGYQLINHAEPATEQLPAVMNEFHLTNSRGTIAMAKLGTDPNSATNQWFFNLANNGSNLDNQNGGFTVFGSVANSASLTVMDKIGTLPLYAGVSPYDSQPVQNYTSGALQESNYVLVTSIEQVPNTTAAGFQDAANFTASTVNGVAPGEIIVVYGTAIGPPALATLQLDAMSGLVTPLLGGTRVLFDGTPGAMIYSSSTQVSVVAPYNLAGKFTTRVAVEYLGVQTGMIQLPVIAANPGLFTLNSSGKGDAAIIRFPDGAVINTANPAAVGDVLELYAEGYGATMPTLADGAIVGSTLPMPNGMIELDIDGNAVTTMYAGGAPALVNGVLQINFKVPQLAPGAHQIQLLVGGRSSPAGTNLQTR